MVYHGTTEIIEKPDVAHSKRYLDFGKGFYLTTYEDQAKKWAIRKGLRRETKAIVNRLWQCTGNTDSTIWSKGITIFTESKCRTSRPTYADIPIVAIKPKQG